MIRIKANMVGMDSRLSKSHRAKPVNTTDPPSKQKKIFFVTFYHYLLNEILFFACMGHFQKTPYPSKILFLPTSCVHRELTFFSSQLHTVCFCLDSPKTCLVALGRQPISWVFFQEQRENITSVSTLQSFLRLLRCNTLRILNKKHWKGFSHRFLKNIMI